MHYHDHQVGITSTDGRNPRGIGSTQMRVSSKHDEIAICEELEPGQTSTVSLEEVAAIRSIALEAREIGNPSNVTPDVEFELDGELLTFTHGPFQWFRDGHFDAPFGDNVTDLTLANNSNVAVIVRGSILPDALRSADAASDNDFSDAE